MERDATPTRPIETRDNAKLVSLWEAERARPESCWSVADSINAQKLAALAGRYGDKVTDRGATVGGALFVWEQIGDRLRISILAEADDDFDSLLMAALGKAQARGLAAVIGHVPESASETRARLNRVGVRWESDGGIDLTVGRPRLEWAVATVAETLPFLTKERGR